MTLVDDLNANYNAALFTYSFGTEADTNITTALSCAHNGIFTPFDIIRQRSLVRLLSIQRVQTMYFRVGNCERGSVIVMGHFGRCITVLVYPIVQQQRRGCAVRRQEKHKGLISRS